MSQRTIVVMQPYWLPYAGYFRLVEAADVFVFLDDVQFPRRGFVHRNKFSRSDGSTEWLTLPVAKCRQDTKISELQFHTDASGIFENQLRKFSHLQDGNDAYLSLKDAFKNFDGSVSAFLKASVRLVSELLGLESEFVCSSELKVQGTDAQDRIVNLVSSCEGQIYLNPPGGRELYDPAAFRRHGIDLKFLAPFSGELTSVADRLCHGTAIETLKDEIVTQTILMD